MKITTVHRIALLFVTISGSLFGYSERVRYAIDQARVLRQVGGDQVGFAGTPDDSYYLYKYCFSAGSSKDFEEMLCDTSPIVRIIGAKCIVSSAPQIVDKSTVDKLLNDETKVLVGPGGCTYLSMTVGAVIAQLKVDASYLGRQQKLLFVH